MAAYYNEIDPFAAAWLRELIKAGHIAPGDVDERSIVDVRPYDLAGYAQCHFFAGIGVWSYAARRAGWPDNRQIWTGSCPCQPFSAAGKGAGFDDERHLWPHFHWLIEKCRPAVVIGEQVASKDGLAWLDLVQADLEGSGYASGAIDTCAAGFGAPHIRQRLFWTGLSGVGQADAGLDRLQGRPVNELRGARRRQEGYEAGRGGAPLAFRVDDANDNQPRRGRDGGSPASEGLRAQPCGRGGIGGVADAGCELREWRQEAEGLRYPDAGERRQDTIHAQSRSVPVRPGPTNGFWRDVDWLFCRDGKWRPVEPGTFPLAHGAPARVGRLRGYGNAINAEQAQAFIEVLMDIVSPALDGEAA